MAREKKTFYRRISTVYTSPDGDVVMTYGVEAVIDGQVMEMPDLDLTATAVSALIACLRETDVDIVHMRDIAADFVQRRGMAE